MKLFTMILTVLFFMTVSDHANSHVSLTESNRLLPIKDLYQTTQAKQISALHAFMLKHPTNKISQDADWQSLQITNESPTQQTWLLTKPINNAPAPIIFMSSRTSANAFIPLRPTQIDWPVNAYQYTFNISGQDTVNIFVPSLALAPTQMWKASWWHNYLDDKTSHLSFTWGTLITLWCIQLCFLIAFPPLPKSIIVIQTIAIITLAQQLGLTEAWGNVLTPLTLWPLLIAILQFVLLNFLMRLFEKKVETRFIGGVKFVAALTLLLGVGYIIKPSNTIGTIFLLVLIFSTSIQALLVLNSLKKQYQAGYFPVLGLYVSSALLAVDFAQYNQITQINLIYSPVIGLCIFCCVLSLMLIHSNLSSVQQDKGYDLGSKSSKSTYFPSKNQTVTEQADELKERFDALETTHRILQENNSIDFLTRLKNRQFFDEKYHNELAISARENKPIGLILIDLDHFKFINDKYGHPIGDEILKSVAKRFYLTLKRPADSICRYGGEEFAILLPNTNLIGAEHIANSIRDSINANPFSTSKGDIVVHLSQGVASQIYELGTPEGYLLECADKALYQAKNSGRDKVQLAPGKPYLVKTKRQF